MADPLDALRDPSVPAPPDAEFAARLRARIQRALHLPRGVTVSDPTLSAGAFDAPTAPPPVVASVTPYLAVAGADRALRWYRDAFGARAVGDPIVMPDGRIGHAELEIAGGRLMLSEEHPAIGVVAPAPGSGAAVTVHVDVEDVDAVVARAAGEGATVERPAADYPYGRDAVLRDPFGHRWLISAAPAAPAPRPGDIAYASLLVADVDRAAALFSAVLGWRYGPASGPRGRQVLDQTLHQGLWEVDDRPTLFLSYAVADIDGAVERVRAAGGRAGDPENRPYGLSAECVDDQGVAFALYHTIGGRSGPDNGTRVGDLAYVTMEVVDSARAREFYGSLLGWTFARGRVDDGWQVEGPVPMVGLSGGHPAATIVPMYRVDDIDEAVRAVRSAGGTATDPESEPYGRSATCSDGHGARFYLGQLSAAAGSTG